MPPRRRRDPVPPSPPSPSGAAALREGLARHAAAWARSALHPPPVAAEDGEGGLVAVEVPSRLVYVDAFAGAEFDFATGDPAHRGPSRAVAATRAVLAAAADAPGVHVLLVEEDPALLDRLAAELEASGLGERVRRTSDLDALEPGEIALVEADFLAVAPRIAAVAGADARALVWLAPPAARRLPWEVLASVLVVEGADVLLRFPHEDFEKQARHAVPLADLPAFARRTVEGCSALLGDPKHEWLFAWRAAERAGGIPHALEEVVERLRGMMEGERSGRPVTLTRLDPPAWLLFAPWDPAATLALDAPAEVAAPKHRAPEPPAEPPMSAEDSAPELPTEAPALEDSATEQPAEPPALEDSVFEPTAELAASDDHVPEPVAEPPVAEDSPPAVVPAPEDSSPSVELDLFANLPISPPREKAPRAAAKGRKRPKEVEEGDLFGDE